MKIIEITKEEYNKIKDGKQTQIIIEDDSIENKNMIILKCEEDKLDAEITAKAKYDSLDDCFKIIPTDLFGFTQITEANKFYKNKKVIIAYRLKIENNDIPDIIDAKLLSIINIESIKKNNVGHSSVDVYEVKTSEGNNAILKIQRLSTRNDLSEEFKRIDWLQNKFRVPKIYYYKEFHDIKYLLMEKIEGVSAHKYDDFAYLIGKKLKEFHSIDINGCIFKQNNIENLMKNALDNIDVIYSQIKEESNMTKEQLIEFIKSNAPTDKVLVHGDYSLPNVLINGKGEVGVIDLGDVSISSKYFDFYYLVKSLKRNKKEEKLDELLKGYGIDKLDDNYMKWIEIVDKVLF